MKTVREGYTAAPEGGKVLLNKLLDWLQEETKRYAVEAIQTPENRDAFEYGSHHGVLKGFSLVEQRLQELLEEEDGDEDE